MIKLIKSNISSFLAGGNLLLHPTFFPAQEKGKGLNKIMATTGSKNILVKGDVYMDNNNFINIRTEQLEEGQIKANFKSDVRNFNQLISLGSALVQTFITSAAELVQRNSDEELPLEFVKLTILDALVDRIGNILNISDVQDNEDAVDSFLADIFNRRNKN